MSVQQSLHIGVAAGDLQVAKIKLLSDEQMAKGVCMIMADWGEGFVHIYICIYMCMMVLLMHA